MSMEQEWHPGQFTYLYVYLDMAKKYNKQTNNQTRSDS